MTTIAKRNDSLTRKILGGGNAIINKSHFVGTTAKYALCGAAADMVLKVAAAKAAEPWQDEPILITDEFLKTAQKAWFPDFPMEYVKVFTVENVSPSALYEMERRNAPGLTQDITSKNVATSEKCYSGKSVVSFKADAFSSANYLFYVLGHELMHVYQNVILKGEPYPTNTVDSSIMTNMKEFFAYNFQKEILGDTGKKLPPCTTDEIREFVTKYPEYYDKFQYFGFDWIKTIHFAYPF